ncbi:MAG TPA: endolytic transglycosylase MltG [Candidatus Baltobacteraceae bacterium]
MKAVAGVVAAALALAIVAGAWFGDAVFYDTSHPANETTVSIVRGSTLGDVAAQLAQSGVIGNAFVFRAWAKVRRADTGVRAGEYRFPPHLTQSDVLERLLGGGAQIAKWVTIPEGFTAKQIATRLAGEGLGSAVLLERAFLRDRIVVDGSRTKNLEGYLFPSTYLVAIGSSPVQIENVLTEQFFKELPSDAKARAKAMGFTIPQIVTVASLIEREAKVDSERPIMAGVYYNRLAMGMPLEVDATIEYALPAYKTELSYADLKIDSRFNSYTHTGLPPTPIANPGRASLEAAFHPAKTPYLYYVYKGNGHHAFARTLEEHNANVAKYEH